MFPIFIPSKGRAKDSYLLNQLKSGVDHWFYVVEPQDFDNYCKIVHPNRLIALAFDNEGIASVRNKILEYCKKNSIPWYWMMDDDISGFYEVISKRNCKISLRDAIERAEQNIDKLSEKLTIGQAGLEYQQYSWSATKKYRINSYCDVCVAINSSVNAQYRAEVNLKEDRDFTLQLITSGYSTVRISDLSFSCPKNGSNDGGLKPVYQNTDRESISNRRMVELWGSDVCQVVTKKDGREDVKINWKLFS
jgi:hypothetical protein